MDKYEWKDDAYSRRKVNITHLKCRHCQKYNIPWIENKVGCPPDYCFECRQKLFKEGAFKWERKDKPLRGPGRFEDGKARGSGNLRALALTVLKRRNAIPTKD